MVTIRRENLIALDDSSRSESEHGQLFRAYNRRIYARHKMFPWPRFTRIGPAGDADRTLGKLLE